MAKYQHEFEVSGGALKVTAHWCPDSHKWLVFGIMIALLLGLTWLSSGELQYVLWVTPVALWLGTVAAFNRTEILVDNKRVTWKERPLPLQRQRSVKLEEIESWVSGKMPVSRSSSKRVKESVSFGAGISRKNGKVMIIRSGFGELDDATKFAKKLADHTGLPLHGMSELRGAGRRGMRWPLMIGFALFALLLIWVLAFQD